LFLRVDVHVPSAAGGKSRLQRARRKGKKSLRPAKTFKSRGFVANPRGSYTLKFGL